MAQTANILQQIASQLAGGAGSFQLSPQQWDELCSALVQHISVTDGPHRFRFRCENSVELFRAESWATKEEGTVGWIAQDFREGDVFYDIGANIGVYTLPAAARVGEAGCVYAFEPHVSNVRSLLFNIRDNGLSERVKVISVALSDQEGFFDFHYFDAAAGTSMSQLGSKRDSLEREFQPAFSELKFATTIDELLERGAIRPADHIKIDVDGNELLVLSGMRGLLSGSSAPRGVQVEVNARYKSELFDYMQDVGYAMHKRHDTLFGKKALAAGNDPESIAYNAIFRKAA